MFSCQKKIFYEAILKIVEENIKESCVIDLMNMNFSFSSRILNLTFPLIIYIYYLMRIFRGMIYFLRL